MLPSLLPLPLPLLLLLLGLLLLLPLLVLLLRRLLLRRFSPSVRPRPPLLPLRWALSRQ